MPAWSIDYLRSSDSSRSSDRRHNKLETWHEAQGIPRPGLRPGRRARAASAGDLVIATVNNGHMIEMQKLTPHFEKANPGIKVKWVTLEEGVLRSARDDRHRHQGRPVRRDDHRHVRDADLGQEGLAQRAEDRCRLRRRRPAAGHAQRPVGGRQAVRRAVLRRELDADVPQGPGRQGRHQVRRAPDLGTTCATPPRRSTTRRPACTASACAASRAGATTWPS